MIIIQGLKDKGKPCKGIYIVSKVLFLPMNTNHVVILESIIRQLKCYYDVLCHDRLCHGAQYFTENILQKLDIPYVHFDDSCSLSYQSGLMTQLQAYFRIRQIVKQKVDYLSPGVLVLFIDNDPVAQLAIRISRKNGIRTILVQDGLIRPNEYTERRLNPSKAIYSSLRMFGISLKSIVYGTGGCDDILVNGTTAREILKTRGVPESKMAIIGQPKYDSFIGRIKIDELKKDNLIRYLFAATKELIRDDRNIKFLKEVTRCCADSGVHLIIKMHPRAHETPEDVLRILKYGDANFFEVVKEGDDTIEILKKCDAVITLSSTVILEALMMDKEGIAVHYLAGEQNLRHYDKYGAIFPIQNEGEVSAVIQESMKCGKEKENKKKLLEDELYKLDGKASKRAAEIIQSGIS